MSISIRSSEDFGAGVLFTIVGGAVLVIGQRYALGTLSKMGPGFFPTMLSIGLIGTGLVLLVRGLSFDGPSIGRPALRSNLFIVAGIIAFGLMIGVAGIVPTVFVTVSLSALAYREVQWREVLPLAVFLAAFSVAVFVYLLGQPLSIWGSWWT
jgi:hypothetical protein